METGEDPTHQGLHRLRRSGIGHHRVPLLMVKAQGDCKEADITVSGSVLGRLLGVTEKELAWWLQ
jgi:hypothetical protein